MPFSSIGYSGFSFIEGVLAKPQLSLGLFVPPTLYRLFEARLYTTVEVAVLTITPQLVSPRRTANGGPHLIPSSHSQLADRHAYITYVQRAQPKAPAKLETFPTMTVRGKTHRRIVPLVRGGPPFQRCLGQW